MHKYYMCFLSSILKGFIHFYVTWAPTRLLEIHQGMVDRLLRDSRFDQRDFNGGTTVTMMRKPWETTVV